MLSGVFIIKVIAATVPSLKGGEIAKESKRVLSLSWKGKGREVDRVEYVFS